MPRLFNLANLQQFTAIHVLSDPGNIGGPVVIPNCMQVVLNWTLASGKVGHNVMYGRAAGIPAPTPAMAQALFAAMTTGAAWTTVASQLAPTTALAGVSLRSVHEGEGAIVSSTGAAVPGVNPGIALPNEMALCVTLRTAKAGPSNRGRVYIPGYAEGTTVAGNMVAASVVSGAGTWVNGFISIFAGQGLTMVIGQKARQAYTGATGTPHPARAAGSEVVTSAVCRDNHWDSQRRRGLR